MRKRVTKPHLELILLGLTLPRTVLCLHNLPILLPQNLQQLALTKRLVKGIASR
jgi:hypothetical protein